MIESGVADTEFSNNYFFLYFITDRNEENNKYLNNVSISPINISQEQLNNWAGVEFNPSKLDLVGSDKALMSLIQNVSLNLTNIIMSFHKIGY